MSDPIDRQAAIDAIRDVCVAIMDGLETYYDDEDQEIYKNKSEVDAVLTCSKKTRAALRNLPSAQPEIIRCKDCKYYEIWQLKSDFTDDRRYKPSVCMKGTYAVHRDPEWFCADAERRTDGEIH